MTPLRAAVMIRDQTTAMNIIAHPRFIRTRDCFEKCLFQAIRSRDMVMFQWFFTLNGEETEIYNSKSMSLLVYACIHNAHTILSIICHSPTFKPSPRQLSLACGAVISAGSSGLVSFLPTVARIDWNVPLVPYPIGRPRPIPKLFFGGSDICRVDGGIPPIVAAARAGRPRVLQMLVGQPNVNVSARGEYGQTFVWELINHQEIFDPEIPASLDLDAQDAHGNTFLMNAVRNGASQIIPLVVRRGANIALRNASGETAWEIAHGFAYIPVQPEPTDRERYIRRIVHLVDLTTHLWGSVQCE
jgi:hypothetical protein